MIKTCINCNLKKLVIFEVRHYVLANVLKTDGGSLNTQNMRTKKK